MLGPPEAYQRTMDDISEQMLRLAQAGCKIDLKKGTITKSQVQKSEKEADEIGRELQELAGSPEAYQLLLDDLEEQMRRMVQAGRKIDLMRGIETKPQPQRKRTNK